MGGGSRSLTKSLCGGWDGLSVLGLISDGSETKGSFVSVKLERDSLKLLLLLKSSPSLGNRLEVGEREVEREVEREGWELCR